MQRRLLFALVCVCVLGLSISAQGQDQLEGAYERVSLINTATGESPEAADRRGLLILAHGHYSMMTMPPARRTLEAGQRVEDLSESDQIAFLREWLDINAHTGRYEVDGDTLVWLRDISEDPREVGTTTRLKFERRDDLLVLSFTLGNGALIEWTWRRIN